MTKAMFLEKRQFFGKSSPLSKEKLSQTLSFVPLWFLLVFIFTQQVWMFVLSTLFILFFLLFWKLISLFLDSMTAFHKILVHLGMMFLAWWIILFPVLYFLFSPVVQEQGWIYPMGMISFCWFLYIPFIPFVNQWQEKKWTKAIWKIILGNIAFLGVVTLLRHVI